MFCTGLQVFDEVSEVVQSALDGYKVCLFSYGQTGAGKTHTMQGGPSPQGRGIMPRAMEKVRTAPAWVSRTMETPMIRWLTTHAVIKCLMHAPFTREIS